MKAELMRNEVVRLVKQVPFRQFVITLEDGTPILIGHPENIAFDLGEIGTSLPSRDFYLISGGMRVYSTFEALASIRLRDVGGSNNSPSSAAPSAPG